jgi:hypothetical protein
MGQFIGIGISLIVLVIILFVLPLPFSNKGKSIIASVSCMIALLGIFAQSVYGPWQILLFLSMLALLSSYFLVKRYSPLLFAHGSSSTEEDIWETGEEVLDVEKNERKDQNEIDGMTSTSELETNHDEEKAGSSSTDLNETFDHESNELIKKEDVMDVLKVQLEDESDTLTSTNMEEGLVREKNNVIEPIEKKEVEEQVDDVVSRVEQWIAEENDDVIEPLGEDELFSEQDNDFNDVEKWIAEENESIIDRIDENEQLDENQIDVLELERTEDIEELADSFGMPNNELEEDIQKQELDESSEQQDVELIEDSIERNHEMSEWLSDESPSSENDGEEELSLQETPKDEINQNYETIKNKNVEEVRLEDEQNRSTALQKELLHTMVEQLILSKNFVSPIEYEQLIRHHLHPSLHDHEYFLFAQLLMEHYVETDNKQALKSFIQSIENRYEAYPLLMKQLQMIKQLTE